MNRLHRCFRPVPRAAWLLILAAVVLAACDHDIELTAPPNPAPTQSWTSSVWAQTLRISGTLRATEGSCLEATILFDGQELPGARVACFEPGGCARLDLRATLYQSTRGYHTIAFQVLRQSPSSVEYTVEGNVLVELNHLSYDMILGPRRSILGAGESVTFDANFT